MKEEKRRKRPYEPPKVFKLDEAESLQGQTDCDKGSGAGSCGDGNVPVGACAHPGSTAGTKCTVPGNTPDM